MKFRIFYRIRNRTRFYQFFLKWNFENFSKILISYLWFLGYATTDAKSAKDLTLKLWPTYAITLTSLFAGRKAFGFVIFTWLAFPCILKLISKLIKIIFKIFFILQRVSLTSLKKKIAQKKKAPLKKKIVTVRFTWSVFTYPLENKSKILESKSKIGKYFVWRSIRIFRVFSTSTGFENIFLNWFKDSFRG